ncbi:hypothetical protein AF088_14650, partial [Listeria monocytogenes]|nr:hypothetical protein [Listeria monocytogenes]
MFNAVEYFIKEKNIDIGNKNKVAIHYNNEKISYSKLYSEVHKISDLLKKNNVESYERVAILMEEKPISIYSFWGTMKMKGTPYFLNSEIDNEEMKYILVKSSATVLIVSDKL